MPMTIPSGRWTSTKHAPSGLEEWTPRPSCLNACMRSVRFEASVAKTAKCPTFPWEFTITVRTRSRNLPTSASEFRKLACKTQIKFCWSALLTKVSTTSSAPLRSPPSPKFRIQKPDSARPKEGLGVGWKTTTLWPSGTTTVSSVINDHRWTWI